MNTLPTINHTVGYIVLWACVTVSGTGFTAQVDERI